ncbi:MAG: Flp pilus assembly complex ATPase component TadA [Verrucomicrobiales bacterium]|nr:Flp pilus assembly complex ATPase component TadA [Verrucomicrobiales bacterium]
MIAPTPTEFSATEDAPSVLRQLLERAVASGASDLHLQRLTPGGAWMVRFRLDGVLVPVARLSPDLAERVSGRVKYLAGLKTYVETLPQEGRIDRAAIATPDDLRVSTYPTVLGEKLVLRLFTTHESRTLDQLGLSAPTLRSLRAFLPQPAGLLLFTGPAGSGKTTTIYACLRELAEGGRHVVTVEDPVEQIIPGLTQTEIDEARGLTFAEAARHLLRQDPEILVIGEIRDEQTAAVAMRAALTGHLLVSTLHAGSCRGVFDRLLSLGVDPSSLAATPGLVVNQRLFRRTCTHCAGDGCPQCLETGYRGRMPVAECLPINEAVRTVLRTRAFTTLQPETALATEASLLVQAGHTDRREFLRILGHEP